MASPDPEKQAQSHDRVECVRPDDQVEEAAESRRSERKSLREHRCPFPALEEHEEGAEANGRDDRDARGFSVDLESALRQIEEDA